MSDFIKDNDWQRGLRDGLLKPFYQNSAYEGRFVFCDKGSLADIVQREMAIDTIFQDKENKILGIEEKIVRWTGREYTAFTLETMSCTVAGREKKGWMYYAKCDILLYCFEQEDKTLKAYAIPFPKLQTWFFESLNKFHTTTTKQINHTECKIVSIKDVMSNVHGVKTYHIKG